MSELYPLLLAPDFHERVWGSRNLAPVYDRRIAPNEPPIGEAWLTGDACTVANGALRGRTLQELSAQFGEKLVGSRAVDKRCFPLLIKFLFPQEKLSVQVHPDDEGAKQIGQACGKTECWYVLKAEPGAQVGLGLAPGTTREQLERAINETRAEKLLNWIDLHAGDLIYVDAGTVHAIGPGSVIVETQQNSDTTYRLYDYGRPRELHIEKGLAVTKEKTRAGKIAPQALSDGDLRLVASPCFTVEKWHLKKPRDLSTSSASPSVLVALEGCGVVETQGNQPVTFTKGEAVVLPAALGKFQLRPQWQLECLSAQLPSADVAEPEGKIGFTSIPVLNRSMSNRKVSRA
jgi:mannose-6-phosphate isomerase